MRRVLLFFCLCLLPASAGCQSPPASSSPLIGITSVYKEDEKDNAARTQVDFAYVLAVADNGGVPVVLPTIDDEATLQRYLEMLDGLVLVGGADIPPSAYGQEPHETVRMIPSQRYNSERKLIARWLASGKPLLGVCLGMQFTNVVSGGSLIQDIASQVGTTVNHRHDHRVHIEPASALAQILGAHEVHVLSSHHQAVKDVGRGFRVVAHSEDGVVEALERTDGRFGLCVQWHPERMEDTAHRDAIYGALVQASMVRR